MSTRHTQRWTEITLLYFVFGYSIRGHHTRDKALSRLLIRGAPNMRSLHRPDTCFQYITCIVVSRKQMHFKRNQKWIIFREGKKQHRKETSLSAFSFLLWKCSSSKCLSEANCYPSDLKDTELWKRKTSKYSFPVYITTLKVSVSKH